MSRPAVPDGVHHVAIQVRDLHLMEAFYRDVLGLVVLRRWPAADGRGDRSIWLDLGGRGFLALEQTPGDRAPLGETIAWTTSSAGIHLLALGIAPAARADWMAHLSAAGVAIAHQTPYTIYVQDPEGNRVGLSHWPHEAVA
jgi:glyoxylase I family protein